MSVDSIPRGAVLDVEGTLARFGGDKDLFLEISGMVLEDLPSLFDKLRRAVADGDAEDIRMQAHALKGLVSGCGGVRAGQVAQQLENAGQQSELRDAPDLLEALEFELNSLTKALRDYQP